MKRLQECDAERDSPYQAVLYSVFQKTLDHPEDTFAVAVTSTSPGEGVTYICQAITHELERLAPKGAVHVSLDSVQNHQLERKFRGSVNWNGSRDLRRQSIEQCRARFKYTMIDCPSLSKSSDVLGIAEFVDGILLVVEANRTKKHKLINAQLQINAAGGKVLGTILNKRIYVIPDFLYRHL